MLYKDGSYLEWLDGQTTITLEADTLLQNGLYAVRQLCATDDGSGDCFYADTLEVTDIIEIPPTDINPAIIVNEVSNGPSGSKEYVELLILGDGSCDPVDIRGYIIDDNNGDFSNPDRGTSSTGISSGHNRFKYIDRWTTVPSGSLIIIYNGGDPNASLPLDDPYDQDGDGIYVLPHTDSGLEGYSGSPSTSDASYPVDGNYGTATWGKMGLTNSRDAMQVRYPDGSYCHGVSYGTTTYMTGGPDDLLLRASSSSTAKVFSLVDADFQSKEDFAVENVSSGAESPGSGNGQPNPT